MVRHAWLLLSSLQVADAEPAQEVVEKAEYKFAPLAGTDFCLVPNYGPAAYTNANGAAIRLDSDGTTTMKGCAAKCVDACKSWTFVQDAAGDHACWDVTPLAPPGAPGSVPLQYDTTGQLNPYTGLAGKCSCPSTSSTALTGDNFPAKTDTGYDELFPVSHRQPAPLACWPKNEFGQFKPADAVVLRSNQVPTSDPTYFAGWCKGMSRSDPLDAGVTCEKACRDNTLCNGFQEVPENSPRTPGCFFGAGYDCDSAPGSDETQALQAGQSADASDNDMKAMRFSRGFVKVVATIKKYRVQGLKQRFDEKAFTMDDPNAVASGADSGDGGESADEGAAAGAGTTTEGAAAGAETTAAAVAETTAAAVAETTAAPAAETAPARRLAVPQVTDWPTTVLRCKEVCEADLHCTVWQVYQAGGTAPNSGLGCWTESVDNPLPYPLSREDDAFVLDEAGVRDGAFIQHWFSEDVTTTTVAPPPPPPPPNRLLPILLTLGGLAALLGVGAYAMGWCNAQEKPKTKRARKAPPAPEPPKEEPRSEPVPTQSALLMSAPVLTYSAAPVTYAAPVATHHVAPLSYAAPPVTTASYQVVHPHSTVAHSTMPYSTSVVVPHDTHFMG